MPNSFKDINGKEWIVALDAPTIKDVKNALQFDLLGDDAFLKLATDDLLLVDTLWIVCRGQAGNITDVDFGRALANGDVIENAAQALIEARRSFFRPGKRSLLRSLEDRQAAMLTEGMQATYAKATDPTLMPKLLAMADAKVTQEIQRILGQPFATNSPATAASVPTA